MIDYDGYCVNRTLNGFDRWTGWQRAVEAHYEGNGSVTWNTTMCSSADPQCRECLLDAWQRHVNGSQPEFPPTTCRGWNGCACALQCNAPDDPTAVYDCRFSDLNRVFSDSKTITALIVVGCLCGLGLIVRWLRRRMILEQIATATARAAREAARRILPGRALDLFGWQTLRRELIARELQLLAGAETVEPVLMPPVNLLHTAPSAPDQTLLDIEDGVESPQAPMLVHPHGDATAPCSEDEPTTSKLEEVRERDPLLQPLPSAPEFSDEEGDPDEENRTLLSWAECDSTSTHPLAIPTIVPSLP
ncbi:hypothetical protein PINS_up012401 [Pythium insidiosum]|nr:hypothetical protein PINS_up012401 [Pythium insidiosum]